MSTTSITLKQEIEDAAARLGISPATVGMRAGQGGQFYQRLVEGKRVWPETAEAVRQRISLMMQKGAA
jgi:hypothetical protein